MDLVDDWKGVTYHYTIPEFLEKRLDKLGIKDEEGFSLYLTGLNDRSSTDAELEFLAQILAANTSLVKEDIDDLLERFPARSEACLLCISHYLVAFFNSAYQAHLPDFKADGQNLEAQLLSALHEQVVKIAQPVINYEYGVYLEAYELGDGDQAWRDFVYDVGNSTEWVEYILESYPVLLATFLSFKDNFQHNIATLLLRFASDLAIIQSDFGIPGISRLDEIELFLGDPHKKWQTTVCFSLRDGTNQPHKVYYKPKSLAGDLFFNRFVSLLNNLGLEKSLEPTAVIDKRLYGWQKGVSYAQAEDAGSVSRFYFRQGINLAIAYILNIQDLIADNILVDREYPVFFDLEMLLVPKIKQGKDYKTNSKAGREFLGSVIKTGMVPALGFETVNNAGFSNSGVSKVSGNTYKFFNTKERTSTLASYRITAKDHNLPEFEGRVHEINAYTEDFIGGFKTAWDFFKVHQQALNDFLLAEKELLEAVQTRILIRLTHSYAGVLNESCFPRYMASFYEYDKLLEYMWRAYDGFFVTENVLQSELDQLHDNEVPYFYTHPHSTGLYDAGGKRIIDDFFELNGIDHAIEKISSLNDDVYLQQLNILRRSFYIYNGGSEHVSHNVDSDSLTAKYADHLPLQIGEFLYLLNRSPDHENYFSYIDFTLTKDDLWEQGIQSCDLFQGVEGLGVFFTSLYARYGDVKYLDAAKKIFSQSIEFFVNNREFLIDSPVNKIGVVYFPISTLYFSVLGNKILKEDHFVIGEPVFEQIIAFLELKIEKDKFYDYLSGATGALLLLMEVYDKMPDDRLMGVIIKLGGHLIDSAVETGPEMISWKKPFFDKWGGFAHGNSSSAYALFKLASLTKDQRYHQSAIKALNYDQSLFDPQKNIWRKSDDFEGEIHHSWGNGSAGIGLSRALIAPYYTNEFLHEELRIARSNIDKYLPGVTIVDHSVGSGFLGMLELRKFIDPEFDSDQLLKQYLKEIDGISKLKCGGWSGNPLVTGLFYGLAGIGYNLIKLSGSENMPSLLWI